MGKVSRPEKEGVNVVDENVSGMIYRRKVERAWMSVVLNFPTRRELPRLVTLHARLNRASGALWLDRTAAGCAMLPFMLSCSPSPFACRCGSLASSHERLLWADFETLMGICRKAEMGRKAPLANRLPEQCLQLMIRHPGVPQVSCGRARRRQREHKAS